MGLEEYEDTVQEAQELQSTQVSEAVSDTPRDAAEVPEDITGKHKTLEHKKHLIAINFSESDNVYEITEIKDVPIRICIAVVVYYSDYDKQL